MTINIIVKLIDDIVAMKKKKFIFIDVNARQMILT